MRKNGLKLVALLLCISLFLVTSSFAAENDTKKEDDKNSQYQQRIEDLNGKISDLKNQADALDKDIANAKNEKEKAEKEKQALDTQIYSTSEQINLTQQKISLIEQNISETEESIAQTEQSINDSFELFKKRIRASYVNGQSSMLEQIFSSNSFGDMISSLNAARCIAEKDKALIEELTVAKNELDEKNQALQADLEDLSSTREQLSSLKSTLNAQSMKAQESIMNADEMERAFLADQENLK